MADEDLFAESAQKSVALVKVLKQVCSRNKALEKQQLWAQRDREDRGSETHLSVKRRDGTVKQIPRVPKGANVTKSTVNQYEQERRKNSERKEDQQLDKFCDGKNHAWRPDFFFTETAEGGEDIPPWPVRPTEIFTNPELCARIMARQLDRKQKRAQAKKEKKSAKKSDKKSTKKDKKDKKKKKNKKKDKGKKKDKSKKDKKSKKKDKKSAKRKAAKCESSSEDSSDDDSNAPAADGSPADASQDEAGEGGSPPQPSPSSGGSTSASQAEEDNDEESAADADESDDDKPDWDGSD
eukprot:TRINITY_DN4181_c0_g5_i1.p2 TRINITY_DN4181_c0_g5~~TRINITY_DN4181_c0_g5_i1.p2  ORF type:complete len:295 (-),score=101.48 TRINITY_DN4181_c0_g5_i1:162-1046(-)